MRGMKQCAQGDAYKASGYMEQAIKTIKRREKDDEKEKSY
jgi:hypothetical protein